MPRIQQAATKPPEVPHDPPAQAGKPVAPGEPFRGQPLPQALGGGERLAPLPLGDRDGHHIPEPSQRLGDRVPH